VYLQFKIKRYRFGKVWWIIMLKENKCRMVPSTHCSGWQVGRNIGGSWPKVSLLDPLLLLKIVPQVKETFLLLRNYCHLLLFTAALHGVCVCVCVHVECVCVCACVRVECVCACGVCVCVCACVRVECVCVCVCACGVCGVCTAD